MSGVMARLAEAPVRDVDAVCRLPELVLLRLWLGCEPELDSPCDVSPEERDDDEVLAVCVVPVPCASPPDEVVELDELLVLELVLLDELLLEGSAAVVLLEDEELVLAVCVLLEVLEEDDSGAAVDDELVLAVCVPLVDDEVSVVVLVDDVVDCCDVVVVLELVELVEDESLGAVLAVVVVVEVLVDVGADVVVVGVDAVVVGVDEIVIGELTGAVSEVEKFTVAGATVDEVPVVVELVVEVLVVCVAVCTAACPAVTAVWTAGLETGLPMITELKVPSVVGGATTVVGTIGPLRVQVEAVPVKVSVSVTATCRPLTGVLLERVAEDAETGPPAAMLDAVSESVLTPASIVPGVSVPSVVNVMPPPPVAVTVPTKLLLVLASVIVLLPA